MLKVKPSLEKETPPRRIYQATNLFMAGDILFYNMVTGKEGMSGWWCSYCKLFKTDWQQLHHQCGEPWTIEGITEQTARIRAGEVNLKDARQVLGVNASPPSDDRKGQ